jgi:hypothetical protein
MLVLVALTWQQPAAAGPQAQIYATAVATPYTYPQVQTIPVSTYMLLSTGEAVPMSGTIRVRVFIGYNGQASDTDGDGLDQVPAELISINLTGNSSAGPLTVSLRSPALPPYQKSTGEVEETVNNRRGKLEIPPYGNGTATVSFNAYYDLNAEDLGVVLHNEQPMVMQGAITSSPPSPGDGAVSQNSTDLYDSAGYQTGFSVIECELIVDEGGDVDWGEIPIDYSINPSPIE